jgi:hypothetical protein
MRLFVLGLLAASLSACAAQPYPMVWRRVDGGRLDARFGADETQCRGEAAQAAAASPGPAYPSTYSIIAAHNQRENTLDAVMQGCMSKRGYKWVQWEPISH